MSYEAWYDENLDRTVERYKCEHCGSVWEGKYLWNEAPDGWFVVRWEFDHQVFLCSRICLAVWAMRF
jgi:hypothetical protein